MRSSIAIGPVYGLRSSSYGHIVYCPFFYGDDDNDQADNNDSGEDGDNEFGDADDLVIWQL